MTYALHLAFGDAVPATVRARIAYAAKLYCAVYGVRYSPGPASGVVVLRYGGRAINNEIEVPATYRVRSAGTPLQGARWSHGLPCFHPADEHGEPDLLGEVFEWVSGDDERSLKAFDPIGRVDPANTVHGRLRLDPAVPWANRLLIELHRRICDRTGWAIEPSSPLPKPTIVATHDLDFLPLGGRDSVERWVRNIGRAAVRRDGRLTAQIVRAGIAGVARRRNPLAGLWPMIEREQQLGIDSSVNVICRHDHPRDANYDVDDPNVRAVLVNLLDAGREIGVHGSYTSLDRPGRLAEEYAALRALGIPCHGGRQHWLRYRGQELFEELRRARALYDSTCGHSRVPGFRHGVSFPFPPWNFSEEAPFPLLEIPLMLMDVSLENDQAPTDLARRVVANSVNGMWGGAALLWHDTVFGGAQIDARLASLYWELKRPEHAWIGPAALIDAVWPRFEQAGLLPPRDGPV